MNTLLCQEMNNQESCYRQLLSSHVGNRKAAGGSESMQDNISWSKPSIACGSQATGSGQELLNLWRVNRQSEAANFAEHSKLANRKLLWHGTNIAVVAAILKAGLRIMPHSCGRVGRGLYLASEHAKSAGYVSCGRSGRDYIGVG